MASASDGLTTSNTGRRRDKFAARIAMIVFRWRAVYMQQPDSADAGLWMSRTRRGKTGSTQP
jgi:hypothetical protein